MRQQVSTAAAALGVAAAFVLAFAANYGFALLGEPRALWLMRLLGVLD